LSDRFSLEQIASILSMLEERGVTEFRLERGDEKIWLKRGHEDLRSSGAPVYVQAVPQGGPFGLQQPVGAEQALQYAAQGGSNAASTQTSQSGFARTESKEAATSSASNLKDVKSPMVGTFYRRPAVDAAPYVAVGDTVKKGTVICIVEAMKLMNEIEAEFPGRVAEICLEDGQMVEYGEVLFRIEPS
jgi:acetyl-CoA carboxylase biotin carboxyl carrier protein